MEKPGRNNQLHNNQNIFKTIVSAVCGYDGACELTRAGLTDDSHYRVNGLIQFDDRKEFQILSFGVFCVSRKDLIT